MAVPQTLAREAITAAAIFDHTIIMYLIDPEGNFASYYGQLMTAPEMAESMMRKISDHAPR